MRSQNRIRAVFGTKMRSVIKEANPAGIKAVVDQQFEIGRQIVDAGLVPIIEPEVDINSPQKAEAEELKGQIEDLEQQKTDGESEIERLEDTVAG